MYYYIHTRTEILERELTERITLSELLAQLTTEFGNTHPKSEHIYLDIGTTNKDFTEYDELLSKESFYDIGLISEDFDVTKLIKDKINVSPNLFISGISVAINKYSSDIFDATVNYEDYIDVRDNIDHITITKDV